MRFEVSVVGGTRTGSRGLTSTAFSRTGRWMGGLTLALGCLLPGLAPAAVPPVVIEIVNLTCPHCAAFADTADQIAAHVRSEGGTFRVAPVSPTLGDSTDPSVAVLAVYWAELHVSDAAAQQTADALYEGFQGGAKLNGATGIASWLALKGVTYPEKPDYTEPALVGHFHRAVALLGRVAMKTYPTLVLLDPGSGRVLDTLTWSGSVSVLAKQAKDAIAKYTQQAAPAAARSTP